MQARNPRQASGDLTDLLPSLAMVNEIRQAVSAWQGQGYPSVTRVTRDLIAHWTNPDKDGLYFAQKEAILTAIWLGEVALQSAAGQAALKELHEINEVINDGIPRICHQMATGTGKTAVMAATILWQTFNHQAYPSDPRFTNRFLAITPGLTVRERLEAGLQYMKHGQPDQNTEYLNPQLHLAPPKYEPDLRHIRLKVVNYHKFIPQDPDGNIPGRVKTFARLESHVETERQSAMSAVMALAGGPVCTGGDVVRFWPGVGCPAVHFPQLRRRAQMQTSIRFFAMAASLVILLTAAWLVINGVPAGAKGPPAGDDSDVKVTVDGEETRGNVSKDDVVHDGDKTEGVDCSIPDVTIEMAGNIEKVVLDVDNATCDTYVKDIVEADDYPDGTSSWFSTTAGYEWRVGAITRVVGYQSIDTLSRTTGEVDFKMASFTGGGPVYDGNNR